MRRSHNLSKRAAMGAAMLALLAAVLAIAPLAAAQSVGAGSSEIYLREQLIGMFQSGRDVEDIPSAQALHPLRRIPLVITTTYLLLEHDRSALERFYPALRSRILILFDEERSTSNGLVTGRFPDGAPADIRLSPGLNALACIEVHCLARIAMQIGYYEDALELTAWSRRLAVAASRTFYNASHETFLPVHENGRLLVNYEPQHLLPLLLDREIGETLRQKMIEKFIQARTGPRGRAGGRNSATSDAAIRIVVRDLLSTLPYLTDEKLDLLGLPAAAPPYIGTDPAHAHWMRFWEREPVRKTKLLSTAAALPGLRSIVSIFERESLMKDTKLQSITSAIATLESALGSSACNLASHKANIAVANRLLVTISNLETNLADDTRVWKVVDESRWAVLSPRTSKLVVESFGMLAEELLFAKMLLSETFTRSTGIVADVALPAGPVPLGTGITMEATIRSTIDSLELSSVYLQFGESRWSITRPEQHVAIAPWTAPLTFRRPLPVVSCDPGLVSIPFFFDVKHEGSRVEIHRMANIGFVKGHHATLRFPAGRVLSDTPLPVTVALRYRTDHNIQGTANGAFLKNVRCTPNLPARFLVKKETALTTLPLEISCGGHTPPGVYPFTLSLELNGSVIARFEETLFRPLQWLYLAPLPRSVIDTEHAQRYQDNLLASHPTADGRSIHWRALPADATADDGSVMTSAIGGDDPSAAVLLYSVVDAPAPLKSTYHLTCETDASLWINGDLVFAAGDTRNDTKRSGTIVLREGGNSILVAAGAGSEPARVSFYLSDQSSLPVPGINNDIATLIDGYHLLAGQRSGGDRKKNAQFTEVTFALDYPSATEICVIGSFNSWEAGADPMKKSTDGSWTINVPLAPGRYPYKFLIDRSSKITDPAATTIEPDGFGGFNSVLVLQ